MRRDESQLQRHIVAALRWRGYLPIAIPNGGRRDAVTGAILKAEGALAGAPDLVVVLPGGQVRWVEVKTARGRLSQEQRALHAQMAERGHDVAVVRSIDEALAAVERAA